MVEKARIAEVLKERTLLLPDLVGKALMANDRAKFYFTWLQAACGRADAPDKAPDLSAERAAVGIDDAALDDGLQRASRAEGGYLVPGAGGVFGHLLDEVDAMIAPLAASGAAEGFVERRDHLAAAARIAADRLPPDLVSHLTQARREAGDSLHLLVMDLHKALNALQAELAEETIDGAKVYRIAPEDRPHIAAFMRGVNRTAPLKFDHPGLGTTATRSEGRLVLQNDIGTTDSHVLIVHVAGLRMTVTYTDVHARRLRFFMDRLRRFPVAWTETRSRHELGLSEENFYLTTGSYEAPDTGKLDSCLEQLGAGLVFLIDWNRARKRLRSLLSKSATLHLLDWAADNEVGHRGFLALGGERLVFDLLDTVMIRSGGGGQRLDELLGQEQAMEFLRFLLRSASEALRQGRSEISLFQELRADLTMRLENTADRLTDLILDHAALTLDIANLVRESLIRPAGADGTAKARAQRAKRWETEADHVLLRLRGLAEQSDDAATWRRIASAADDATDALEEAMFSLTLLADAAERDAVRQALDRLAGLVAGGTQDYIRAVAAARRLHRGASRESVRCFLASLERLRGMEHATDEAEREVVTALTAEPIEARRLFVVAGLAQQLESAGDALLHAGLMLGDHVLDQRLRS
jgi:hypothetical protein